MQSRHLFNLVMVVVFSFSLMGMPRQVAAQNPEVTIDSVGGVSMWPGTVVAWGDNRAGQTNVPPGLSDVIAVSGGVFHSLALKNNGTVVAWGCSPFQYGIDAGQCMIPPGLNNVIA